MSITRLGVLGVAAVVLLCGRAEAVVTLSPPTVAVAPGTISAPISVYLTFNPELGVYAKGFGTLAIDNLPAGVTTSPSNMRFEFQVGNNFANYTFRLVVSPNVRPGGYTLRVRDTSRLLSGQANLALVVQQSAATTPPTTMPQRTTIRGVVPPSVSAGSARVVVRLLGQSIPQDAEVETNANDVLVLSSRVLSSELIEAVLSVRTDATPGPRSLLLRSMSRQIQNVGAQLLILPSQSIAAPAQVLTASTLYPRTGALVGPNDRIYPRGLLAASGTGTVVGTWRIDGMPFDRFAVQVYNGRSVKITSRMPVPPLIVGEHYLEMVIESPQRLTTEAVRLLGAAETASDLRALAPHEGARFSLVPPHPTFRWSLVPGATGYEIEIEREGRATFRRRLSQVEWTLDPALLRDLGSGVMRWRVRAVFPGDVRGTPTADSAFALVPASVAVTSVRTSRDAVKGRARISWSVDSPGAIYKVEILREQGERAVFSALTFEPSYLVPARAAYTAGRSRVRVTAYGPRGEVLGASEVVRSSDGDIEPVVRLELAQEQAGSEVTALAPPENGTVTEGAVRIEAQWSGIAAKEEVFLEVDGTDVTEAAVWSEGAIVYEPAMPLSVGAHEAKLGLKGVERKWRFTVEAAATDGAAGGETGETGEMKAEYQLSLQAGLSLTKEPEETPAPGSDVMTLQGSGQGQVSDSVLLFRGTGDIAFRRTLDEPKEWVKDNQSWIAEGGLQTGVFSAKGRAGYGAPDFVDQSELLTTGLVIGGVQGRLGLSYLSGAVFKSMSSLNDGVASGMGLEQETTAFSLELAKDPAGSMLRAVHIRVDDPGIEADATVDPPILASPPRDGTVTGVLGRLIIGTGLNLTVEGAQSSIAADPASGEEDRKGAAARMALTAVTEKGLTLTAGVHYRGRDFVNPASDGFTASGTPGTTLEASVTQPFDEGRGSIMGTGQYMMSPSAPEDEDAPDINSMGGSITLSYGVGMPVSATVTGTANNRNGDSYDVLSLPETDQADLGATATLTETWRGFSLSQAGSYQKTTDDINPLADTTTLTGNLSLNGGIGAVFTLAASAGLTRVEAEPATGQTDSVQVSLQPSFTIPRCWLTLQPTITYSTSKNEVILLDTISEQYGGVISFAPPWVNSLISLQLTADWSRTVELMAPELPDPSFVKTFGAALTLKWGATGSMTSPPPPPPPTAMRNGSTIRAGLAPAGSLWRSQLTPRALRTLYASDWRRAANLVVR